jgi:hypothetical protein
MLWRGASYGFQPTLKARKCATFAARRCREGKAHHVHSCI